MRTMLIFLVLEVTILGGLAGYLQVRYAQAGYPASSRWRWALFLSGFITIATCVATFLYYEATSFDELLLFSVVAGIVGGLFAHFVSPYQMQYIYPKRDKRDG